MDPYLVLAWCFIAFVVLPCGYGGLSGAMWLDVKKTVRARIARLKHLTDQLAEK